MPENTEQKKPVYNNKRFKPSEYNFDMFVGPRAGEPLKNFSLTDLSTGNEVKLSDFSGKWIVIETASSTCSMYTKNIPDMKDIAVVNDDVEFIVVYVREAHPGLYYTSRWNYPLPLQLGSPSKSTRSPR
jgi:hypothetical protein